MPTGPAPLPAKKYNAEKVKNERFAGGRKKVVQAYGQGKGRWGWEKGGSGGSGEGKEEGGRREEKPPPPPPPLSGRPEEAHGGRRGEALEGKSEGE